MKTQTVTCHCGQTVELARNSFRSIFKGHWKVFKIIHEYHGVCGCGTEYKLTVDEPVIE